MRRSRYFFTWRSSLSTSWSIDAFMSGEASRARSVGPLVQIVASATWLAAIGGFVCSSAASGGTGVTTTCEARGARVRRPRSFQARTKGRAGPAYANAATALTKDRRRPAHSRQRSTGQAVGAPQRAQRGGVKGRKDARHAAHSPTAEAPQDTQRGGSRRSTSHAMDGTRESVNRLCRLRVETRAGRRGNELASICDVSATLSPRLT